MQGVKNHLQKKNLIVSLDQDAQFFKFDADKKYELAERLKKGNDQMRSELLLL